MGTIMQTIIMDIVMSGFLCELVAFPMVIMAAVVTLIMAIDRLAVMVPPFMVLPTGPTEAITEDVGVGKAAESILAGKQPFRNFDFLGSDCSSNRMGNRRWENTALLGLVHG